jgi:hypothetical protein
VSAAQLLSIPAIIFRVSVIQALSASSRIGQQPTAFIRAGDELSFYVLPTLALHNLVKNDNAGLQPILAKLA